MVADVTVYEVLEIDETGMAYIQLESDTPSQYRVTWYPPELNVTESLTYLSDCEWVEDLEDEPREGYFFAFEDENFGWDPGYVEVNFDLPIDATVDWLGLEWNGIGLKYLWDNIYAYYRVENTTIWNGFQKYIYDSSWIDYSQVSAGEFLTPGERNRIRFGATNESDWSEHVVDTMRWSFHGWHPGEGAGVSSATLGGKSRQ